MSLILLNIKRLVIFFSITFSIRKRRYVDGAFHFEAIKDESSPNTVFEFTNIAVDNVPYGQVYVGGRNYLYQLKFNLQPYSSPVKTGPVENNVICKYERPLTDNLNKVLLLDYQNERIIVCGSVEEGICELRKLGDLQKRLSNDSIDDIKLGRHVAAGHNLSTVGFLATMTNHRQFFYVGSSKTEYDVQMCKDYTSYFTISKRTLPIDNLSDKMFSTVIETQGFLFDYGIKMKNTLAEENFRIRFIHGFATDVTGYFVLSYPNAADSSYSNFDTTYVSQFCLEDSEKLYSYLELPIECNVEGIRYNKGIASHTVNVGTVLQNHLGLQASNHNEYSSKVLFVSFVQSNGQPGSAVCMFSLQQIEKLFVQTVRQCLSNSQRDDPKHIFWIHTDSNGFQCVKSFNKVSSPVCASSRHMWDTLSYLQGNIYSANAFYKTDQSIISSIAIAKTQDNMHTVAIFGTNDGYITKIKVDSNLLDSPDVMQYEKVPVNPLASSSSSQQTSHLNYSNVKKLQLGSGNQLIYAMTPSVIIGLPLYDCSRYNTCSACLSSNDPFCGWCTLESKCCSYFECQPFSGNTTFQYLKNRDCPKLTSEEPLVLTVLQSQIQVSLTGRNLPFVKEHYYCRFGDIYRHKVSNIAKLIFSNRFSVQIDCITPPHNVIPTFQPGQGYLTLPLKLEYENGVKAVEIASTDFIFYNCSVYNSCMSCVNSAFNCFWCLDDNVCTYKSTSHCPQNNVEKPNRCPQLQHIGTDNKVYIPASKPTDLELRVRNLPDSWHSFTCVLQFDTETSRKSYRAIKNSRGSRIVCKQVLEFLPSNVRYAQMRLQVFGLKGMIAVDNPMNISVEVYRCRIKTNDNCGTCLQSPPAWRCGWCDNESKCTLASDCLASDWLKDGRHKSCRNPIINSFTPKTAPFGGNSTVVTLNGVNFDSNRKMMIMIGDAYCRVISSSCCEAECVPYSKSVLSSRIRLCITTNTFTCSPSDEYNALSKEEFSFVDPKINSFSPHVGLVGWGSAITVNGEDLNSGNNVLVSVDGSNCVVERRSRSKIHCKLSCTEASSKRDLTSNSQSRHKKSSASRRLTVSFDGVHRVSKAGRFLFEDDVAINNIDPATTLRSGKLPLKIYGVNLGLIPNPRIKVKTNGFEFNESCEMHNKHSLVCLSPVVSSTPFLVEEGFIGLYNQDCEKRIIWFDSPLLFSDEPVLDYFEGEKQTKIFRNEVLHITGKNLCPNALHCDDDYVNVLIGEDISCNITRFDIHQITCLPEPFEKVGKYSVQVIIGGFSQQIGFLEYTIQEPFPDYMYAILGGIGFGLILVVVVVVCVYRGRAKASDLELKNVQMQMDLMDAKVAKICKEAFAELQTDMCQVDTLTGGSTIHYLEYRDYLMRVLFPDPVTSEKLHSLLLSRDSSKSDSSVVGRDNSSHQKIGMHRFDMLLENKIFLLSFIKALENQQNFVVKDKALVAGLIMVILHNRLQYATEILEHLLADLIHKNIEGRNHPKLLLRRTESVAEKLLTHWFSILLHRFVVECAGEPLYTLFRAIKQQIDRGPLDAFTNEARYSLSEDKLLRQSIDHEVLSLHVVNRLDSKVQPEFIVKVLSCDTVTQAKRKILDVAFAGIGYSLRWLPENVDLELSRDSLVETITLYDEDTTNYVDTEWKKLNTLEHYSVRNGDKVTLMQKKEPSLYQSTLVSATSRTSLFKTNGTGGRLHRYSGGESTLSSLTRYKSYGMGTITTIHNPTKLYHLVKPNDHDLTEGGDRGSKMVSEVYLTRLLTTKGTIQKYVDDLFEAIFSVIQRGHTLPLAVKHMFDFLDCQAEIHNITDADVKHTWKSNCLPLRFWVNLIKNPEFVFDINKSPIVDCYLTVIAQAFMDSCSTAQYKLGKDSPSNKLLYAKEIQTYRQWASTYYSDVSAMPKLNPKDMAAFLQEESSKHFDDFNRTEALTQLYKFAEKYNDAIIAFLDRDSEARRQGLMKQFQNLTLSLSYNT